MPQPQSIAFLRHKMKERWGTNNNKTNATEETTEAQTNKNCQSGITLVMVSRNTAGFKPVLIARNQITVNGGYKDTICSQRRCH